MVTFVFQEVSSDWSYSISGTPEVVATSSTDMSLTLFAQPLGTTRVWLKNKYQGK